MRKIFIAMMTGLFILSVQGVSADNHEKAADSYIYATYFYCDVAGEKAADEAFKKSNVPTYKKAMSDDLITGWGYLKHHTGGKWRRITYHMGTSVSGVIAASEKMGEMMDASAPGDAAFAKACRQHDDYIWKSVSGNLSAERGKVGMSVYMKCDMSKEERADEIVAKNFAPIYDAHLGEGKLTSWGWSSHIVGGSWRRLLTMTAADIDTLIEMRGSILTAAPDMPEGEEFVKICGSHQDYIWNIAMEGRK